MSFEYTNENALAICFMLTADSRVRTFAKEEVTLFQANLDLIDDMVADWRRARKRKLVIDAMETEWHSIAPAIIAKWEEFYPGVDINEWFLLDKNNRPTEQPEREQIAGLVSNLASKETYKDAIVAEYPELAEHVNSFCENTQCKCRSAIRAAITPRWIRWKAIADALNAEHGYDLYTFVPEGGQTVKNRQRKHGTFVGGVIVEIDDTEEAWKTLIDGYISEGKYWNTHSVLPSNAGKVKVYFA